MEPVAVSQSMAAEAGKPPILYTLFKRPLVPVAFSVILGILAAAYVPLQSAVYLTAMLAAILLAVILRVLKLDVLPPLLLVAFLAGYARLSLALPQWAADVWAPADEVRLSGRIAGIGLSSGGSWQYTLDAVTLNGEAASGRVLITSRGNPGGNEGDTLSTLARLERPEPSRYYGGFNARGYYLRRGIRYTCFAASPDIKPARSAVWNPAANARLYASETLSRYLGADSSGLVSALLYGETGGISADITGSFIGLGVAHLLAVSGLNISLTAGAAWLLCRKLRIPIPVSLTISFLVMASYVLFAGLTPSVLRAAVMWAAMMGGLAVARRYDALSSISAACIVILALNPLDLFDAGFQLSFAATSAIILWLAPLMRHAPRSPWGKWLFGSVGVTVCVTAMALPIVLGCFNAVSLMSPLGNLVLVPASFLLQLGGMALLFAGLIPGVAVGLGAALDWAARFYLENVRMLGWAGTSIAAATPPLWLSAAFLLLAAAVSPALARLNGRVRVASFIALFSAMALMLLPMPARVAGKGDAAVIAESRKEYSVYWETGGKRYAACSGRVSELTGYLKRRGVTRLDGLYLLRAKPPNDGSLLLDLKGIDIEALLVHDVWLSDAAARPLLEQAATLGIQCAGAGGVGEGEEGLLSLVLPAELARGFLETYNISDCGSVELYLSGGKASARPWRNGWENGIQGNFR